MDHRINLLGASGSGTSTVGRLLAAELRVPHFECDDYYHAPSDPPFQILRDSTERVSLLKHDLGASPSWVLSGGVVGWSPDPELDFTAILFLLVPAEIRLARLRRREHERFGARVRPGGDMHAAHEAFIDWAARYDHGDIEGKTLARHEAFLQTCRCPVLRLDGRRGISEIVQDVLEQLNG